MSRTIPSNTDDLIDSRDVEARIEELEAERDRIASELEEAKDAWLAEEHEPGDEFDESAYEQFDEDDADELKALLALREEAEGYAPDWYHGTTLVRDDYFEDYARQTAEDIGAISRHEPWPQCHIDWEAAADALKQDYTSVDFDGVTYWVR